MKPNLKNRNKSPWDKVGLAKKSYAVLMDMYEKDIQKLAKAVANLEKLWGVTIEFKVKYK